MLTQQPLAQIRASTPPAAQKAKAKPAAARRPRTAPENSTIIGPYQIKNPSNGERRGQGRRERCVTGEKAAERRAVASPPAVAHEGSGSDPEGKSKTRASLIRPVECVGKGQAGPILFPGQAKMTAIPIRIWIKNGPQQST